MNSLTSEQRFTAYQAMKIRNFNDVLAAKTSKSFKKIASLYGERELQLFLADIIAETAQFMNVGKNMNAAQCLQTAEIIMARYPAFHLEDMKLCMHNGKAGDYGKTYDRFDGMIILEWFDKYSIEKIEYIENAHYTSKTVLNAFEFKDMDEKVSNTIKNIFSPQIEEKGNNQKNDPPQNNLSEFDVLVQKWIKEFDVIFEDQKNNYTCSSEFGTMKFIDFNGKIISCEEFLKVKVHEHNKGNSY